jgi:hypothetical protein
MLAAGPVEITIANRRCFAAPVPALTAQRMPNLVEVFLVEERLERGVSREIAIILG